MSHKKPNPPAQTVCPRVILRALPRSLGLILALAGGFLSAYMFLTLIWEESIAMAVVTVIMALVFLLAFLLGVALLLMPLETVRVSKAGLQLCLGGLVLRRIPLETIRSVTCAPREVRISRSDQRVNVLQVNCNGKFPLYMEWSAPLEQALRQNLPDSRLFFFFQGD